LGLIRVSRIAWPVELIGCSFERQCKDTTKNKNLLVLGRTSRENVQIYTKKYPAKRCWAIGVKKLK